MPPSRGLFFWIASIIFTDGLGKFLTLIPRQTASLHAKRIDLPAQVNFYYGIIFMRTDQDAAQVERVSLAYRRLANAMILSTLREISKSDEVEAEAPEVDFVESARIDPWCELAGLEPEVIRRAAHRLIGVRVDTIDI